MLNSFDDRNRTDTTGRANDRLLIAALVVLPFAVRLWLAASIPLTEDEAYYRLWALAPAMSYLDHPPMVGWMMAAGMAIAGDTALGMRLPALLATAVSTMAVWRTALLLAGRPAARLAVLYAASIPLLSVGSVVMTPDTPSVLFFVLGAWALGELDRSRNPSWWLPVGLFAGLGLLSKYTNFFFGLSILTWLVVVRSNWRWFASWQLYAGGALAITLFAPVIAWNIEHGGASFAKQFGRVVDVDGFKFIWQLEMWSALLFLLGPVTFVLAFRGARHSARRFWNSASEPGALLLALTLPLLAYFTAHALHGRVLPNWLAPAYPVMAILAAVGTLAIADPARRQRTAAGGIAVSALLSVLIYAHAVRPVYVSAKAKEPTHQLRGWPEFAAKVDELARQNGASYVATTSYGTTGHLAFYLDQTRPVLQLNERLRYVHLPILPRELFAKPGIAVELARRRPLEALKKRFASVEPLDEVVRSYNGERLQTYLVFRMAEPFGDPLAEPATGPEPPK